MTQQSGSTIACDLGALTLQERQSRAGLAARIGSLAVGRVELDDGYDLRLAPDPDVARDALEWILLESRCCPFLRLELHLEAERGPLWIRMRGAPGVKAFLSAAGFGLPRAVQSCGC
jgi:hypothetical protein